MTKDTGGAAFPWTADREDRGDMPGMTLRDYFAAKAMHGMTCDFWPDDADRRERISRIAYAMADAMIMERNK